MDNPKYFFADMPLFELTVCNLYFLLMFNFQFEVVVVVLHYYLFSFVIELFLTVLKMKI